MKNGSRNSYKWLCASLLFVSMASFAGPFSVVTEPGTTLPSTVIEEGKSYAYYRVTNITSKKLTENFVKHLPDNVSQETIDPNYCGKTFALNSGEYCTLKLIATDTVALSNDSSKNIFVCADPYDCSGVDDIDKLNIQVVSALAAGGYYNGDFYDTLLVQRQGNDWQYVSILPTVKKEIAKVFTGISCAENFCMGAGLINDYYEVPLLAMTSNGASAWAYQELFSDNFEYGKLVATSCADDFCVTGGYACESGFECYYGDPLVAYSNDGLDYGIIDVVAQINEGFCNYFSDTESCFDGEYGGEGFISATGCSGSSCIVAGAYYSDFFSYCDEEQCFSDFPLLLTSDDDGDSWEYVLPINESEYQYCYDGSSVCPYDQGEFTAASCSNKFCIAAGLGFSGNEMIVAVQGGNDDWYYAIDFMNDFYDYFGRLADSYEPALAVNCSGDLCVIVGAYNNGKFGETPFLAYSRDGFEDNVNYLDLSGTCESDYQNFICPKNAPPSNYEGFGALIGISCDDNICAAAGYHYDGLLLLQSTDNGNSWYFVNNVPSDFDVNGVYSYTSVSCSAGDCFASGYYSLPDSMLEKPLLAESLNGGPWSFVNTLPDDYDNDGIFYGVSAPGNGNQVGIDTVDYFY